MSDAAHFYLATPPELQGPGGEAEQREGLIISAGVRVVRLMTHCGICRARFHPSRNSQLTGSDSTCSRRGGS